ncbi:MAG TPA: FxSxx-COOH system tetratricopeptide repeat protein [Pseudonocardiaceae bacterium]|nr:FxSxx-COOH system tetratricopeptide repeat protein [Pseudonocardiaceae bacterium]
MRPSLPRAWKWVVTLAAGAAGFVVTWWICARLLTVDTGIALGIAALPGSLITLPLAWWAGREETTTPPAPPAPGQLVVGPVPREPQHFQRREQIDELARLAGSGTPAVVCGVTGQRGVGKTQLVGAYARQRITDEWLVAWIPSETADAVATGLGELGDALGLRHEGDADATVLARVRSFLQTRHDPALLVFDNVTDTDHVTAHLPAAGSAQIVLTSVSHAVERLGTPVPVDLFSPAAAVRFLAGTTGIRDEQGARALADKLGYLPLALAQAAARIAGPPRGDYAGYLRRLADVSLDQALAARPGDPYPLGAAEAILLAVEPFRVPARAAELALLDVLSVLSPDGVSRDLLDTDDELLNTLFEASLIEFAGSTGDAVVTMHRLTQRVLRERVDHDLPAVIERAARVLDDATFAQQEAWQRRDEGEELVRHIDALWAHTRGGPVSVVRQVLALRQWAVRQLTEAMALERAVHLAEAVDADHSPGCDGDDPDRLVSVHDLATAYLRTGRIEAAIPLFEQALATARRLFDDDDPNPLVMASNLAGAYFEAGRLAETITLLEQILPQARRVFGDDDPTTRTAVGNLTTAYLRAGRLGEAIPLYEQGLTTARRLFGDDSIDTLRAAVFLATAYHDARQPDKAIPLLESTITTARAQLGDDHPFTLRTASNLAVAYVAAERLDEAIPLYERTLGDQRRLFGDDDLDSFFTANNLADSYRNAGRLDEATALFEQTLADRRRVLGDDHPETLTSAAMLAGAYLEAERSDEAIALFERTLADRRRVLGDDHPDTVISTGLLGGAYLAVERVDEATELWERSLADRRRILGDDHLDTISLASDLAVRYEKAGRLADAVSLYERTLAASRRVLGDDHPVTLLLAHRLAGCHRTSGRPDLAIPLHEEVFLTSRRVLGDTHPNTVTSAGNLATAYFEVGRPDAAIPYLERAFVESVKLHGDDHIHTITTAYNLATAYREVGRRDDAVRLYLRTGRHAVRALGTEDPITQAVRKGLRQLAD